MAIDTATAISEDRRVDSRARAEKAAAVQELVKRKKLVMVQLALIDSVLEDGRNHSLVELLNERECDTETLKAVLTKSSDALVRLIWYANFGVKLEEDYSMEEEIERFVQSRKPSVCSWPRDIREALSYLLSHIVRGSNWIFLNALVR